jgi:signal transduction histidine kinase
MNRLSQGLHCLFLVFLLTLLHGPARAELQATGHDIKTEVHTDAQNRLTIATIAEVEFSPLPGNLYLGFKAPVTWLRMTIRPIAQTIGQPLILRIGPYTIDELTFYQQIDGQWTASSAGSLHPAAQPLCQDDKHCFAVDPHGQDSTTVYLKIQTHGFPVIDTEFIAAKDLAVEAIQRIRFTLVSMTIAGCLLLAGLIFLQIENSALLRCYCCYQACVLLLSASGNSTLAQLFPAFPAEWLNLASDMGFICRSFFFSLAAWLILAPYRPSKGYRNCLFGFLALAALLLPLPLLGESKLAIQLHFLLQFWMPWLHLYGILTAGSIAPALRNILLASLSLVAILFSSAYASTLGWFDSLPLLDFPQEWRLTGAPFGLIMLFIIFREYRDRQAADAATRLQLELTAAKAKSLEDKTVERGAMIDMLTHELKTPLGTIRFAIASAGRLFDRQTATLAEIEDFRLRAAYIESSVNRMDAMILQVAKSHRMELSEDSTTRETIDVRALLEAAIRPYALTHRFEQDLEAGLQLHSDPLMLTTVIDNLISNACKYSIDQIVRLSATTSSDGFVQLTVANRVAAGTEPDEAQLFSRYYRNPATSDIPGSGMGLHIAHSAAGKIGATLTYRTIDGVVTFELRIPC